MAQRERGEGRQREMLLVVPTEKRLRLIEWYRECESIQCLGKPTSLLERGSRKE